MNHVRLLAALSGALLALAPSMSALAQSTPYHSMDLTAAMNACGGPANFAYVDLATRQYIQPPTAGSTLPSIEAQITAERNAKAANPPIQYGCASQAKQAGYAAAGTFRTSSGASLATKTPLLASARTECSLKHQTVVGTLQLWYPNNTKQKYLVWNPHAPESGAVQHFDDMMNDASLQPVYTCANEVSLVAGGLTVLAYPDFSRQWDIVNAQMQSAQKTASTEKSYPACMKTYFTAKCIDTSGNRIIVSDDDARITWVALPAHVSRGSGSSIVVQGETSDGRPVNHSVTKGTVSFTSDPNGYFFALAAVSNDSLKSGSVAPDVLTASGKTYIDSKLVAQIPTNVAPKSYLISPVGGSAIVVPAGVIAAGAGNVIAAGAYNFSQAQIAQMIANEVGNNSLISHDGSSLISHDGGSLISNAAALNAIRSASLIPGGG